MKNYIHEKLRAHPADAARHALSVLDSGYPHRSEVMGELINEQRKAQCSDLIASMRGRIRRWPWPVHRLAQWALTKLIPDHIAE
jgi:hypothetical protein